MFCARLEQLAKRYSPRGCAGAAGDLDNFRILEDLLEMLAVRVEVFAFSETDERDMRFH